MASLSLGPGHDHSTIDLQAIYDHCARLLPTYAWPRFIRIQNRQNMTSTFKLQKVELTKEGFNPEKVKSDPLYCLDLAKKMYVPLTADLYSDVVSGKVRF